MEDRGTEDKRTLGDRVQFTEKGRSRDRAQMTGKGKEDGRQRNRGQEQWNRAREQGTKGHEGKEFR